MTKNFGTLWHYFLQQIDPTGIFLPLSGEQAVDGGNQKLELKPQSKCYGSKDTKLIGGRKGSLFRKNILNATLHCILLIFIVS